MFSAGNYHPVMWELRPGQEERGARAGLSLWRWRNARRRERRERTHTCCCLIFSSYRGVIIRALSPFIIPALPLNLKRSFQVVSFVFLDWPMFVSLSACYMVETLANCHLNYCSNDGGGLLFSGYPKCILCIFCLSMLYLWLVYGRPALMWLYYGLWSASGPCHHYYPIHWLLSQPDLNWLINL